MWTDEKVFSTGDLPGNAYVWVGAGETLRTVAGDMIAKEVENRGKAATVMVAQGACFSKLTGGTVLLPPVFVPTNTKNDAESYRNLVNTYYKPQAMLHIGVDAIFQQDNAPAHSAKKM